MKSLKNKRGISLIVLVITIIVMIILAAAVILALSSNGIIGKANKAKEDSDNASLKEYINVLMAEWEVMTVEERKATNCDNSTVYINNKIKEKGYTNKTYSADGEIYTDLPEIAQKAIAAGIEIGDKVNYEITEIKKCTPDLTKFGLSGNAREQTTKTDMTWIYIGVSDNGELLISPDVSEGVPEIYAPDISGSIGWATGPGEINRICEELYTTDNGIARSMNIDDVTRVLGYTGTKGYYEYEDEYGGYNRVRTPEAKKLGEIEEELGITLSNKEIPENGKRLEDYYSVSYEIDKINNAKQMKNSKYVDLIYPSSGRYFLASSSIFATFIQDYALLYFHYITPYTVTYKVLGISDGRSVGEIESSSLRPVVSLTSSIQKSTENGSTVWSFCIN